MIHSVIAQGSMREGFAKKFVPCKRIKIILCGKYDHSPGAHISKGNGQGSLLLVRLPGRRISYFSYIMGRLGKEYRLIWAISKRIVELAKEERCTG